RVRRYLTDVLGTSEPQTLAWYRHWMKEGLSSLEEQLARRSVQFRFCFSEKPGLADACLVPQIDNARRFNCDLSPYPRLVAVDAECRALEAFMRAAPAMQPDYPGE
ncbi:MAG: maleylacetoacetate isomerase, partial [Alphaproteobacteria bacterium]|nr:maleylacetoacetate isomerase [Alphaproteobacteria bacterium]